MHSFLAPLVSWIFREVVIKFGTLAALFFLIEALMPRLLAQIAVWTPAGITDAFSAMAPGVWWFLDKFALDVGVPLVISAHVTAFTIRRIPVIG